MNIFRPTISKDEISNYPLAEYNGEIHIIQTPKEVEKATSFLKTQAILGFDTETRPTFKKGKSNEVSLLQLSTESLCFLFRLNLVGFPTSLTDILSDSQIKKIGVSLNDDFRALNQLTDIQQTNFIDLQNYVKSFQIEEKSLMKIYAIIFEKRISKSQRLSNWEADFLTEKQKKYAALDAWAAREIYIHLESMKDSVKVKAL